MPDPTPSNDLNANSDAEFRRLYLELDLPVLPSGPEVEHPPVSWKSYVEKDARDAAFRAVVRERSTGDEAPGTVRFVWKE